MKILCPGGYTYNNKGDAALVICMLAELERVFPGSEVTVLSDSPELDSGMYKKEVLRPFFGTTLEEGSGFFSESKFIHHLCHFYSKNIEWRHSVFRRDIRAFYEMCDVFFLRIGFHFLLLRVWLCLKLKGALPSLLVPRSIAEVFQRAVAADSFVFVPGGYLIAPHSRHTYWLRHVAAIYIARWLRKPTYFYACTIGPFHGRYNSWLARSALNSKQIFFLRENSSKVVVEAIAPKSNAILSSDVAFLLPICDGLRLNVLRKKFILDGVGFTVGISVRDYHFPGHPNPEVQRDIYLNSMASVIDHLILKHNARVCLVPQVLSDDVNDLLISEIVEARVSDKRRVNIIRDDLCPSDLKGLYSCFDFFIGVRMHANIFAISAGVPTVAIAYEPKTFGIMTQLSLERYAISIREVSSDRLIHMSDDAISQSDAIRGVLADEIPKMCAGAMSTAEAIRDDFTLRSMSC